MTEPTISCPKCNTEIKLTESLVTPHVESTQRKFEKRLAQKDADIAGRETSLFERGFDVTLPRDLYDEASTMILNGETILAAQKIHKSMQMVSLAGAWEIAEAICSHLRRIGERA